MFKNRYLMLSTAVVITLFLGVLYAWSVFVIPLEKAFGWVRPETSRTFTLLMTFFCLGMLCSGKVLAKIGPSKTVFLGGALGGVGFFAASYTSSLLWLYLTYGVIAGFGIGLANVVLTGVILRWFSDKRGFASGVLTAALALGAFFLGAKGAPIFLEKFGWEGTFRFLGIAYWVAVCPLSLLIRFPKAGEGPGANAASAANAVELWGYTPKEMLRVPTSWFLMFWLLFIHTGGLMLIGHIAPYVQSVGFSPEIAAFVVGVLALSNAAGRFTFGFLFDNLGRKPTMILNSITISTGLLVLAFLPAVWGYPALIVGVILSGMAYGGSIPQLAAMVSGFFGPKFFTTNYGVAALASMVAAFSGPLLAAEIMHKYSYKEAIVTAALISGFSLLMAILIRAPKAKA